MRHNPGQGNCVSGPGRRRNVASRNALRGIGYWMSESGGGRNRSSPGQETNRVGCQRWHFRFLLAKTSNILI